MSKYKLHTAVFIASAVGMLFMISGVVWSWRTLYDYISTIESLRFWLALTAFVISASFAATIIIGWILIFVRNSCSKQEKKSKQPC